MLEWNLDRSISTSPYEIQTVPMVEVIHGVENPTGLTMLLWSTNFQVKIIISMLNSVFFLENHLSPSIFNQMKPNQKRKLLPSANFIHYLNTFISNVQQPNDELKLFVLRYIFELETKVNLVCF